MEHDQVAQSTMLKLARIQWLVLGLAGILLGGAMWSQPARADWTDDVSTIAEQASQGNYIAAEEIANQSLQNGPGTFLFGETGTLVIHQWRGRLRLLGGDAQGAIADAQAIIEADSSYFPPDIGYALRGMAKAIEGNADGSEADFASALKLAGSGSMSALRLDGGKGERAIARMILNDFAGAMQDLNEVISGDNDTLMMAPYVKPKKEAWTHLRQAIVPLETGDLAQAAVPIRAAIDVLLTAGTQTVGSDFLSFQLILMQIDTMAAERQAIQL